MCRIAGIINPALSTAALQSMVNEMCALQQHGGPDDEGFYTSEEHHLVLGHRRLSLIDLSSCGHQPMAYEAGRYQLSYNGELYNYLELKKELQQAGLQFKTASDTEVILAAFAKWGTPSFKRFNGMFAFALWDAQKGDLYLVRDASGIKPLYYACTPEGLAFASETRAFKPVKYLGEEKTVWPVYLLAYGHLPAPVTKWKEIKPLQKGSWLRYHAESKSCEQKTFLAYEYSEKITDASDAVNLVRYLLEKSVKHHLLSDAPIGVFLSGGLDSSILSLLASRYQQHLKTVSIYFDDEQYSEKKYQDLLTAQLNPDYFQHLVSEAEFHEFLPAIITAMDLPSCDGINTWFISRYARQCGLKAVLSGIGGDELFGGYPSFKRIEIALLLKSIPKKALRSSKYSNNPKLQRLAYLSLPGAVGQYLFLRGQFTPAAIARELDASEQDVWSILEAPLAAESPAGLSSFNQASWLETNMYMQNQLLRDVDVMSMAHGLEIRVPFLDNQLIKCTQAIATAIKQVGSRKKHLLIEAFKTQLPAPIWNRPKMGFAFPYKKWLSHDQYSLGSTSRKIAASHKQLQMGEMHWSQFFTLLLMENPYHA